MQFFTYFVAFIFAFLKCDAKTISIEKVEIDIDPKYLKISHSLSSKDGINMMNLNVDVLQEEADVTYQAVVYRHNEGHFEQFYRSELESGCNHGEVKDPVLSFMFKESKKYGNITEICPLKVGHYQVKDFKIDSTDMPHELPSGSYRFDFTAFIKKDGKLHDIYTDKYYFSSN